MLLLLLWLSEATCVALSVASAVAVAVAILAIHESSCFPLCVGATQDINLETVFLYSWVLIGAFRFIAGPGSGETSVFG